jgi:glycogen operon protein
MIRKQKNWDDYFGKSIVVFLNGEGLRDLDRRGTRVVDSSFLLAFNAHDEDIEVALPGDDYGLAWAVVVDTVAATVTTKPGEDVLPAGGAFTLAARSMVVLQRVGQDPE